MSAKSEPIFAHDASTIRDGSERVKTLETVSLGQFLTLKLPKRRFLLSPWLPEQGLAMIYAPRGVGKTYLGLSIGLTVASSSELLGWRSATAANVVYIDGEMPAVDLQERLARLIRGQEGVEHVEGFHLINADLNRDHGMPDLSTSEGQNLVDSVMPTDTGLIIVDNLSSLTSGDENDATQWHSMQKWILRHRSCGRSVILIHHAGKKGSQRGTSRREDVLDTVINLRRPKNYSSSQGARFEVHFEKNRGICGPDALPFEALLQSDAHGGLTWLKRRPTSVRQHVRDLLDKGHSQTEIAKLLRVDKSTVSRHAKQLREDSSSGGQS